MTAMSGLRLQTTLVARGPAAAILLTDEQVAALGAGKAFPVVVSIGEQRARLRLARMGGENMIGFTRAVRAELGLEIGQDIEVSIDVDSDERTVEVPLALTEALRAEPTLQQVFDALSYSARKEMARQIADAKQDDTRQRRLQKALHTLRG